MTRYDLIHRALRKQSSDNIETVLNQLTRSVPLAPDERAHLRCVLWGRTNQGIKETCMFLGLDPGQNIDLDDDIKDKRERFAKWFKKFEEEREKNEKEL